MTVTTTTAAFFAWALIISIIFNWYWSLKLGKANTDRDNLKRIIEHNSRHASAVETLLISGILEKANLPGDPPPLDYTKWSNLVELYDDYDMLPYEIPAQITTDNDNRPAVYWKVTNINELDAYVIARLWLAGVL